jgi:hypothetical protein
MRISRENAQLLQPTILGQRPLLRYSNDDRIMEDKIYARRPQAVKKMEYRKSTCSNQEKSTKPAGFGAGVHSYVKPFDGSGWIELLGENFAWIERHALWSAASGVVNALRLTYVNLPSRPVAKLTW